MKKTVVLGDEAIALGAIDAGATAVFAYPGTPSTEITEFVHSSKIAKENGVKGIWCANEKTAVEAAIGASYAGKRSMACMKHVGLNVAADAFMNSSIVGANGGIIIVSADDPSMHSSQNEQDSRYYGNFAMTPILEPSNQQEAYEMTRYGYDLSEKFGLPVLMRITTRLAHSRAGIVRGETRKQNELCVPKDPRQFVLLPSIAKKRYKLLLSAQKELEIESDNSEFNKYIDGADKSLGIIASGIAYNYLMENYPNGCPFPILKITQYPLPRTKVEKICKECKEIFVMEEGAPLIEESIKGYLNNSLTIHGRLDGWLPRDGELNPNLVAIALNLPNERGEEVPEVVKVRPPQLCHGCGHIDFYNALNEALKDYTSGRVMSDIGCYTLGALAPYEAINSCVDMGASITMAKGAAEAGLIPAVGVLGDSTFTHSGMTGLLDCVVDNAPVTICILDNSITAMTGGQNSHAFERLEKIVEGIGVEKAHIRIITPLKKNHEENVAIIKEELAYNGVSVIIPRRDCVVAAAKIKKLREEKTLH